MRHPITLVAARSAAALLAAGVVAAGCSSTSSTPTSPATTGGGTTSSAPATGGQTTLKTGQTSLGTTLENSGGFVVYWFAADHGNTSACTGACASAWPPVTGTPTAASGVTLSGTLGTISRGNGVMQATYNGHPLYTFAGDSAPGQANGNGSNGFGALWHAITIGSAAPGPSPSHTSGGYGY